MSEQADQVVITLTGVSATGYHGVFPHERTQGQTFVVDAAVTVTTPSGDDVADTVDYGTLAERMVEIVGGEPVNLIETLAERIATALLAHDQVNTVTVTVHKPQAPLTVSFADVSVTVTRP